VWADIDQQVSVGDPAAFIPALVADLRGHGVGGAVAGPDDLAFGDDPQQRHQHLDVVEGRVDFAAEFGHPQRYAVQREQGRD